MPQHTLEAQPWGPDTTLMVGSWSYQPVLGHPLLLLMSLVTGSKHERRQKLDFLGGCAVWTLKSKAWAAENVSKGKLNINSVHGTGHMSLRFATS